MLCENDQNSFELSATVLLRLKNYQICDTHSLFITLISIYRALERIKRYYSNMLPEYSRDLGQFQHTSKSTCYLANYFQNYDNKEGTHKKSNAPPISNLSNKLVAHLENLTLKCHV